MKVKGVEIPQSVIDAALARMRETSFAACDIEYVVNEWLLSQQVGLGVRREVANRAADRIIQTQRKAGAIERGRGRFWRWVAERAQVMTDAEYNEWFSKGYEAFGQGEEQPPADATEHQRRAWFDGWYSAQGEFE